MPSFRQTLNQEPLAKKPRLDDFSDLCDPEDMGQQRNELAEHVNLKVAKDIDITVLERKSHIATSSI
jgi:hypothetical protein